MSLLIKGGDIVDGSGGAPKKGDVLLIGNKIAAIGNLASYKAEKTVSASGCFVVPGFIDMASEADRHLSILSDRKSEELLLQGITTIIGGGGGVSLAPLLYGSLESFSPWSKWESINIGWHSMADLMNILDSKKNNINFASFVGYDSLKKSLSKKKRGLSKNESQIMTHIISTAIKDGALGISLSSEDSISEDMSEDEKQALKFLFHSEKIMLSIDLPPYLKKTSETVENIIKWANFGVPILIQNFSNVSASEKELLKSFNLLENATVLSRVIASACPLGFNELSLLSIMPPATWSEDPKQMSLNILKKRNSTTIEKNWPKEKLSNLWIVDSPKANFLVGKKVSDFANNRGIGVSECFSKIVEITSGRVSFCTEVQRDNLFEKIILHPRVTIESGAYGLIAKKSDFHRNLNNAFGLFLEIANRAGINIEKSIMKTSSLPAIACGLGERGLIEEGFSADIVIMKDRCPSWVFVNGVETVREGELTDGGGGKVIKKHVQRI